MGVQREAGDPARDARRRRPGTDPVGSCGWWDACSRAHRRLQREIRRFHARVEAALRPWRRRISRRGAGRAGRALPRLERELLRHWRAPLVNDFLAMIFFGVLGRLVEKWLPGAPPALANDLLCGEGGIISTEPARRVLALRGRVGGIARSPRRCFSGSGRRRLWRAPDRAGMRRVRGRCSRLLDRSATAARTS